MYEETVTTSPAMPPAHYVELEASGNPVSVSEEPDYEVTHWPAGTNSTTVGINKTKVILSNVTPQPCSTIRQRLPANVAQSNRMLRLLNQQSPQLSASHTPKVVLSAGPRRTPLSLYHAGGSVVPSTQSSIAQTPVSAQKPNKTLVHKYHSFRRILPKSPDGKAQHHLPTLASMRSTTGLAIQVPQTVSIQVFPMGKFI
ncbi:hypothetical protein Ciccas_005711 [Cichlidogyrus casuarinus]|uniref:Uncharacterized protein n=1 Tax=Cichlidogyrus casuarinus TaxID=1844966 RepID=A0ABD2Q8D8_9PLAT